MYNIKFRYIDEYSHGAWSYQSCICDSVQECIDFYGLNEPGVEYEILSKELVKEMA